MVDRGCPQGSCLGPVLWLVIMEDLFERVDAIFVADHGESDLQAYADDSLMTLIASSLARLQIIWDLIWPAYFEWAAYQKLEFNRAKSHFMFHPSKPGVRPPVLNLLGERVAFVSEMRYLGVTIDPRFCWTPHLKALRARVGCMVGRLRSVASKTWGISQRILKEILLSSICPLILYASEVWGDRASEANNVRQLSALARGFLLAITRAYRTTSTDALYVLAGVAPLHLTARSNFIHWHRVRSENYVCRVAPVLWPHPSLFEVVQIEEWFPDPVVTYDVYTDGSGIDGRVGCAVSIYNASVDPVRVVRHRLPNGCSVFQAESYALFRAFLVLSGLMKDGDTARVCCDAKSVLASFSRGGIEDKILFDAYNLWRSCRTRGIIHVVWVKAHIGVPGNESVDLEAKRACDLRHQITLPFPVARSRAMCLSVLKQQWQLEWDFSEKGRLTYEFVATVDLDVRLYSSALVQFMTGHGPFRANLFRFRIVHDASCRLCGFHTEDVPHLLFHCGDLRCQHARAALFQRAVVCGLAWPVRLASLLTSSFFPLFCDFIKEILLLIN
jgi:ribonuclease HI